MSTESLVFMPVLRFPEFEGEWERKKIGETCEIKTGNKDTQNRVENGIYPFFVRSNTVERIDSYSFDGEAILTSGDGVGVGKNFHYINGKFDFHQRVYSLRNFDKKYSGLFIFYLFSDKFYDRVIRLSAKNSVDSVRMEMIYGMEISLPILPEQKRIASFFNVLDEKLNQLKQKKNLLVQYKKGVMQQLFSQELRFKDDDGKEFPDWESKKLGEVVEFRNGKAHERDISEFGNYIVVNSKFISTVGRVKKYSDSQIAPLFSNEIVMVMSDVPNGKALSKCFIIDEDNKYTLNQRICALKTVSCNSTLLFYVLNRNKYYLSFDSGVGQTNLTKDEVVNCPIHIPVSIAEQTKIANFLSAIDEKINQTQTQIQKTEQYKKGLLQKMFC